MINLKNLKKNKRGGIVGIIVFVGLLFLILLLGFVFSVGGGIVTWVSDNTIPELTTLGEVEGVNLSQAGELTLNPINNIIQQSNWLIGVLYVIALIGSIGFAAYSRFSPDRWLIGFYFMLMLILILGAILVSNMYEDVLNDGGELSVYLQDQTIMAFMIVQAPMIFTFIGFITAIIIFSGFNSESEVSA